jgi:hypothetical protein
MRDRLIARLVGLVEEKEEREQGGDDNPDNPGASLNAGACTRSAGWIGIFWHDEVMEP